MMIIIVAIIILIILIIVIIIIIIIIIIMKKLNVQLITLILNYVILRMRIQQNPKYHFN